MNKRLVSTFIGIVILLIVFPLIFLVIDVVTDIYPKSKDIRLNQTMVSNFRQQTGVHKRTCRHVQWFFVARSNYEPAEILQYYEDEWNRETKPVSPLLAGSEHQGRFFSIFSFTTSKFELSMEKYLGYTTQNITLKEYVIGNHLYICSLEDWYE